MKRLRILGLCATAAMLFSACGGHGTQNGITRSAVLPPAPMQPTSFSWSGPVMRAATYVGPAHFDTMSLHVTPRLQGMQTLRRYAESASDPKSPLYRHFLTPQEIGARFGASQADLDMVTKYFAKYHVTVGTWPQHLLTIVTGKQSDLEAAFGTKFGLYRGYGKEFVAPTQTPHFAQANLPVAGVSDLVHVNVNRRNLLRGSNGEFLGMSPQQIRRAFDFTGAASAGFNGSGITVGIIGTGPIWSGDVPAIGTLYHTSVATVHVVPAKAQAASSQNNNTGTGQFDDPTGLATPPPVIGDPNTCDPITAVFPTSTCNAEDGEAQLDTEQVSELATGATVNFYLAFNNKDCTGGGCPAGSLGVQGLYVSDDEIQQAIADNTADSLSLSYGLTEPDGVGFYYDSSGNGIGPAEFAALAAEGIAVFVSSGDNGAHACTDPATGLAQAGFCIQYPQSDPSVVSVGGVNYPMDSAGNLPPIATISAWASNTTLEGDGYNDNSPGSGGGVSQIFSAPSWQSGLSVTPAVTGVGTKRTTPDVALLADGLTGPFVIQYANYPSGGPYGFPVGGTSAAAPEMAALWAVVLQACKASTACATAGGTHPYRLGNPAGLFYSIYARQSVYASSFFDVVQSEDNGNLAGSTLYQGYPAGPGYDLVTGVGVPFAGHLINAVVPGQNVP